MRDFQRKQKIRKTLYSPAVLLAIFVLLILISKATFGLYAKEKESRKNLDRVETELAELEVRKEKLRTDIARLQTTEGIETEIREQFQVAKPGERMIVLVDEKGNSSPEEEKAPERSLMGKFFDWFR